jgi:mannosyltransferase
VVALSVAALVPLLALIPFLRVVAGEKSQVAWLADQSSVNAWTVLVEPWFEESIAVAVVGWLLLIAGGVLWRRMRGSTLALAGAWVVVPWAGLLLANFAFGPLYSSRYLSFTAPGLAFLLAAVLLAVPWRRALPIGLAVLVIAAAPSYVGQRSPFAKNGGSDLRQLAETVHAHAHAGDAVAFDSGTAHPRQSLDAYPQEFAGLVDIGLVTPFPASRTFGDAVLDTDRLPLADVSTLWFGSSTLTTDCANIPEAAILSAAGLTATRAYPVHRTTVCEFVRG